jgi:hypothetical protein
MNAELNLKVALVECTPANAPRFREWIKERGGIAIWRSINLSNPGASWSTPTLTREGTPTGRPTWEADSKPSLLVTRESEVAVVSEREVKRFRVAIRRGTQGLQYKLTDASSRRLTKAVEAAGEGARYVFDYETQEACILVPDKTVPLDEWTEG